jgi:heme A synthase
MSAPGAAFYDTLTFDVCNLVFQAVHVLVYLPLSVLAFRHLKLEVSTKVNISSFLLVFLLRTVIGIMSVSEALKKQKTIMSIVLEVILSIGVAIIYLALYYMVFEMQAAQIILKSLTFETFKKSMRKHKISRAILLISVLIIQGFSVVVT